MFIEKKRGAFLDKLMHSEEPLRKRFNFGYKYLKFLKIGFKKNVTIMLYENFGDL